MIFYNLLKCSQKTRADPLQGGIKAHLHPAAAVEDVGNLGALDLPDNPRCFFDLDHPPALSFRSEPWG